MCFSISQHKMHLKVKLLISHHKVHYLEVC